MISIGISADSLDFAVKNQLLRQFAQIDYVNHRDQGAGEHKVLLLK